MSDMEVSWTAFPRVEWPSRSSALSFSAAYQPTTSAVALPRLALSSHPLSSLPSPVPLDDTFLAPGCTWFVPDAFTWLLPGPHPRRVCCLSGGTSRKGPVGRPPTCLQDVPCCSGHGDGAWPCCALATRLMCDCKLAARHGRPFDQGPRSVRRTTSSGWKKQGF